MQRQTILSKSKETFICFHIYLLSTTFSIITIFIGKFTLNSTMTYTIVGKYFFRFCLTSCITFILLITM